LLRAVRHEALFVRMEVGDLRCFAVVAVGEAGGSRSSGVAEGGWEQPRQSWDGPALPDEPCPTPCATLESPDIARANSTRHAATWRSRPNCAGNSGLGPESPPTSWVWPTSPPAASAATRCRRYSTRPTRWPGRASRPVSLIRSTKHGSSSSADLSAAARSHSGIRICHARDHEFGFDERFCAVAHAFLSRAAHRLGTTLTLWDSESGW